MLCVLHHVLEELTVLEGLVTNMLRVYIYLILQLTFSYCTFLFYEVFTYNTTAEIVHHRVKSRRDESAVTTLNCLTVQMVLHTL